MRNERGRSSGPSLAVTGRRHRVPDTEPAILDFRGRSAWRRWLERNLGKSSGEWVYVYKKNSRIRGLQYPDALDEALCFGWIDGQVNAVDENRFRQRWTPRRSGSIWSLVNKTRVRRLIAQGRMAKPGLAAVNAAKRSGAWQKAYSNVTPTRIPGDLAQALKAVPQVWSNFRGFAPSYRRMYIGWVADAKQPATRERRIAAVVRRARVNRKPGMDSLYA